jgi:hypothetical protein
MSSDIIQSIVRPSVAMQIVINLSYVMPNVTMLSAIMPSVTRLNGIMLRFAECYYAKCHHSETESCYAKYH